MAETVSYIAKATAPIWLLIMVLGLVVGGGALIVHGNSVWRYFGIGGIVLGWIVFGGGWGIAIDLSRRVLDE